MMYFIPEYLFKIIQQQQENLNKLISNKEIKINLDSLKINQKPIIEISDAIKKIANSIEALKNIKLPENIYNNIQIYKDYYKEINNIIPSSYLKYDKDEKRTFIKNHDFKKLNVT